jgi:hypothetical protein
LVKTLVPLKILKTSWMTSSITKSKLLEQS